MCTTFACIVLLCPDSGPSMKTGQFPSIEGFFYQHLISPDPLLILTGLGTLSLNLLAIDIPLDIAAPWPLFRPFGTLKAVFAAPDNNIHSVNHCSHSW